MVIRHAQTVWNAAGKIQGQADPELSETGREQCQKVAERLAHVPIDAIHSSDLGRARGTADAVAAQHGLEVQLDKGLREVDLGEWEGADRETLARDWPELFAAWVSRPSWDLVPGGEGAATFEARVMQAFGRIASASNDAATVAVVTHIGVIRTLLSTMVGADAGDLRWPWAIDNTGLTVLEVPSDVALWATPRAAVVVINDNRHVSRFKHAAGSSPGTPKK